MGTTKGVRFCTILAGNRGLIFDNDERSVYINWDELVYELETLELYRTYATVKGFEDDSIT